MRCSKCGEFVTREEVEAMEDEEVAMYVAYIHADPNSTCICLDADFGSLDAQGPQLQFYAVDQALQVYFKDGMSVGQNWLDVQRHDLGKEQCKCESCIRLCSICQHRMQALEK